MSSKYLGNKLMRATRHSLALISTVLMFDIVELWYRGTDVDLHCTYAHVTEPTHARYPALISGFYPNQEREHRHSPQLCEFANQSPQKYHWLVRDEPEQLSDSELPVITEIAYKIEIDDPTIEVFLVGFSAEKLALTESKLKFLSGLGYAIYVAAFDLDEAISEIQDASLDLKMAHAVNRPIVPAILSVPLNRVASVRSLDESTDAPKLSEEDEEEVHAQALAERARELAAVADAEDEVFSPSKESHSSIASSPSPEPAVSGSPPKSGVSSSGAAPAKTPEELIAKYGSAAPPITILKKNNFVKDGDMDISGSNYNPSLGRSRKMTAAHAADEEAKLAASAGPGGAETLKYWVPSWAPLDDWAYAVGDISVKLKVPSNLTMDSFTGLKHIGDGSNSNIYLGFYKKKKVIVKMIKEDIVDDEVAAHEFDMEHGILARLDHPNIIKILGAGHVPRRFVCVEYLEAGSLNSVLSVNIAKPGFAAKLFRKPTFTYPNLLLRARELADSLDYIHRRAHKGCCLIHRDLKPDNVGFTAGGVLKLFDFGLCTLVKTRINASDTYEMTGNTGSLRYMAPEVISQEPYTEKCDVYSYGIMVWQMARDRVPFAGYNKADFIGAVVEQGVRPKLDKSWPPVFCNLLTRCWDRDAQKRPSFKAIVAELDVMMNGLVARPAAAAIKK